MESPKASVRLDVEVHDKARHISIHMKKDIVDVYKDALLFYIEKNPGLRKIFKTITKVEDKQ